MRDRTIFTDSICSPEKCSNYSHLSCLFLSCCATLALMLWLDRFTHGVLCVLSSCMIASEYNICKRAIYCIDYSLPHCCTISESNVDAPKTKFLYGTSKLVLDVVVVSAFQNADNLLGEEW